MRALSELTKCKDTWFHCRPFWETVNVSLHSSSLQKKHVSWAYTAEEVHSSVAGLTALCWEIAKTRLNPTALLLGSAGFLRFSHHWILQHTGKRVGLKAGRSEWAELPPLFSPSPTKVREASTQMLDSFHLLCSYLQGSQDQNSQVAPVHRRAQHSENIWEKSKSFC